MCPTYTFKCDEDCGEFIHACPIVDRDLPVPCAKCGGLSRRGFDAPALKDFTGSHRDEYTKTGPRK